MNYSRDFLLQVRLADASLKKPTNLPKLPEVILEEVSYSEVSHLYSGLLRKIDKAVCYEMFLRFSQSL